MVAEDLKFSFTKDFPEGESNEKILKELDARLKVKSYNNRRGRYVSTMTENGFVGTGRLKAGWALYHFKVEVTIKGNHITMDSELFIPKSLTFQYSLSLASLILIPPFVPGLYFPVLIPLQLFLIIYPFYYKKRNRVENKILMEVMLSGLQNQIAKQDQSWVFG